MTANQPTELTRYIIGFDYGKRCQIYAIGKLKYTVILEFTVLMKGIMSE